MNEYYKCILCGIFAVGFGNNPEPIVDYDAGRCCDECNQTKVIPARIAKIVSHHPSNGRNQ